MGRVEAELIAGGVYLDCTWTFVLRPVGAERTRLLMTAAFLATVLSGIDYLYQAWKHNRTTA